MVGNLDIIAGFQAAPSAPGDGTDFWSSNATVVTAIDPIASLPRFDTIPIGSTFGANFDAGLSVLWQPGGVLQELVVVPDPLTGNANNHGLGVVTGITSGLANAEYSVPGYNPFTSGFTNAAVTFADADVYPVANEAKMKLYGIPEPGSIAIWSAIVGMAVCAAVARRRRRR